MIQRFRSNTLSCQAGVSWACRARNAAREIFPCRAQENSLWIAAVHLPKACTICQKPALTTILQSLPGASRQRALYPTWRTTVRSSSDTQAFESSYYLPENCGHLSSFKNGGSACYLGSGVLDLQQAKYGGAIIGDRDVPDVVHKHLQSWNNRIKSK